LFAMTEMMQWYANDVLKDCNLKCKNGVCK